jgi:osmoprotectant transport system substrate-binding protein
MTPTRRAVLRGVGAAVGSGLLAGCSAPVRSTPTPTSIRVGSKPFPEQEILGYLAYQLLQRTGEFQAVDEIGAGNSATNWDQLRRGNQDLYFEYTGTIWLELPQQRTTRVSDPEALYSHAKAKASSQDVFLGQPAPFSNEWVLVLARRFAERTGIETVSQLVTHLGSSPGAVTLALDEEFSNRPDGWPGLARFYGLDPAVRRSLRADNLIVTSVGLPYELLARGEADVGSGFATDPQLDRESLVVLEDDRDYFLPYQPVPATPMAVRERYPAIFERLAPVLDSLKQATIRGLNRDVIFGDRRPSDVALRYLQTGGFL